MILGLDIGTKIGWSLPDGSGQFVCKGRDRNAKLATGAEFLADKIALPHLRLIVFETPFARGQAATRMLWGFAGIVECLAAAKGVHTLDFPPSTFKKWFVGHGHANKDEMFETAQMFGFAVKKSNDHEVDAIAIRMYAEAHY